MSVPAPLALCGDASSPEALYQNALLDYLGFRPTATAAIETLIAAKPDNPRGLYFKAYRDCLAAQFCRVEAARELLATAEALPDANHPYHRLPIAALRHWCDGRQSAALKEWHRHLGNYPDDVMIFRVAYGLHFMRGEFIDMTRLAKASLDHLPPESPHLSFVKGCYAFSIEELRDYNQAETLARAAFEQNQNDVWAAHALMHVYEMHGRATEGLAFFRRYPIALLSGHDFLRHLGWHKALFEITERHFEEALAIHDEIIWPSVSGEYRDLINTVSLLARLEEIGVNIGDRWATLGAFAIGLIGKFNLGFANVHLALALLKGQTDSDGVGAFEALRRLMKARADKEQSIDQDESRDAIAYQLALAAELLCKGLPAEALAIFRKLRREWWRMGGSSAQREIFEVLTRESQQRTSR